MPFQIIRNDITKMHTDAIVNTANPKPAVGSGTDSAIYEAAGREKLLAERMKIGPIARGQAAITPAFNLNAKYIIHTVGPVWTDGTKGEEELLRSCYENSLQLALKHRCKSISFPMISTGVYGFPKDLALQTVLSVVSGFLSKHDMMIYLVVFDKKATKLSEKLFSKIESRIDDAYARQHALDEYYEGNTATVFLHDQDLHERARYLRRLGKLDFDLEEQSMPAPMPQNFSVPGNVPAPPPPQDFQVPGSPHPDFSYSMTSEPDTEKSAGMAPLPASGRSANKALKTKRRSLKDLLQRKDETFQQMLLRLIKDRGLTGPQVYTKANVDKKLFSKIKNNKDYQPKKKTVLAFAIALELSLDETIDLLARAGYAFTPGNPFDIVIRFCIEEHEYDIFKIEAILYDYGLETICNYG